MTNHDYEKCRRCEKWYRNVTRTNDGKWICVNCKANDDTIRKQVNFANRPRLIIKVL